MLLQSPRRAEQTIMTVFTFQELKLLLNNPPDGFAPTDRKIVRQGNVAERRTSPLLDVGSALFFTTASTPKELPSEAAKKATVGGK